MQTKNDTSKSEDELKQETGSRIWDYQIAREFRFRPDHMGGRLAPFDEKVREMINGGWTPIGGPFVDEYGTGQAMVKISSANVQENPTT